MSPAPNFNTIPDGYPKLAAFISKDQDWNIFRKFKSLNVRNLLYLQCEMQDLEAQLTAVDDDLTKSNVPALKSWTEFASDKKRLELVKKIRETIENYTDSALIQYGQVMGLPSPSYTQVQNFRCWLSQPSGQEPQVIDAKEDFLDDRIPQTRQTSKNKGDFMDDDANDLATLSKKLESRLDLAIQMNIWLSSLSRRDQLEFTHDGNLRSIRYFSSSTVQTIAKILTVILVVAVAVASIVSLYTIQGQKTRLGFIGVFTFVMALILSICGAKRSEIMVGTIGYAAVLVVFVSSSN